MNNTRALQVVFGAAALIALWLGFGPSIGPSRSAPTGAQASPGAGVSEAVTVPSATPGERAPIAPADAEVLPERHAMRVVDARGDLISTGIAKLAFVATESEDVDIQTIPLSGEEIELPSGGTILLDIDAGAGFARQLYSCEVSGVESIEVAESRDLHVEIQRAHTDVDLMVLPGSSGGPGFNDELRSQVASWVDEIEESVTASQTLEAFRAGVSAYSSLEFRGRDPAGVAVLLATHDQGRSLGVGTHGFEGIPVGSSCRVEVISNGFAIWDPPHPALRKSSAAFEVTTTAPTVDASVQVGTASVLGVVGVQHMGLVDSCRVILVERSPDEDLLTFTERRDLQGELDPNFFFRFDDVPPGRYVVCTSWRESDSFFISQSPVDVSWGDVVDAGVLDPSSYGISVSTGVAWSEEYDGLDTLGKIEIPEMASRQSLYVSYRPKYQEVEVGLPYWFAQQIPLKLGDTLEIRGCKEGDWFLSLESGFHGAETLEARVVETRPSARLTLTDTWTLEPVHLEYTLMPE